MSRELAARLTWFIAGFGVLAVVLMLVRSGVDAAASAGAGAAVALGNWFLLRLIVDRVISAGSGTAPALRGGASSGSVRKQAGLSFLLIAKMGGLIGLVFLLLRSGFVQVVPFTIGVSSLMAGAIFGSFLYVLTAKPVESER
jgi:hypothetical protein